MGLGISNLLVAALLGSGAFMQPAVLGNQQRVVSSSKRKSMTTTMFDEFGSYGGAFSYPKRLGWSNRMVPSIDSQASRIQEVLKSTEKVRLNTLELLARSQ